MRSTTPRLNYHKCLNISDRKYEVSLAYLCPLSCPLPNKKWQVHVFVLSSDFITLSFYFLNVVECKLANTE